MSYIGGPLPGQERDEEYPQDIGKETFQKGVKSISDTYQKLPEPVKKNVSEASRFGGEIFSGLAEMNREARESNILGLGPLDPFIGATKLYDKAIEGVSDITGIYKGYFDLADFFIPATPTAIKLSKRLRTTNKANKLINVTKNLNRLDEVKAFSFATKVDDLTGITNVKSEVMQLLSKTDNFDDIFVKGSNSDLSYKKIIQDYKKASGGFNIPKLEKTIQASITKHQLPTNLKAYKKINVRKYNKYINDELKHWAEHGKGSGKYFNIEHSTNPNLNIRYRLDQKSNPSKILDASGKIIDRSFSVTDLLNKKIQNLSQADRLILLQNTTLDKATISKVAKLTPGGKIMHHAAPVQSTSKIQEAFFKTNPNLTMDDWIPIQRKVEKELNFAFGDSPLNARYPETIKQHEQYHGFLREAGLYPNQLKFPDGLSPNDAYLKLKELGTKVLEIDKKVGVKPEFTKKTIGKQFANRSQ